MIFIIHICLALILFFLANWVGKNSLTIGYMQLGMFLRNDEAPAFNFLYRIFTPIVYTILVSYLFYTLKLDYLVISIYNVIVYYFAFRFLFNIFMGRSKLINWFRQFIGACMSIFFGYWVYQKIIVTKSNLLPDFTNINNELWLIIIIFIYQIFNKVSLPNEATKKRKNNYLTDRYKLYKSKYGKVISTKVQSNKLEVAVYSILLYEAFNRPKLVRIIENIFFYFKKSGTLGIMQVSSKIFIDDNKSIKLGIEKILNDYNKIYSESKENQYSESHIIRLTIEEYNTGESYSNEVSELYDIIAKQFYPDVSEEIQLSYY